MRFKVDDGRLTRTGSFTVFDDETRKPLVVTSKRLDVDTAEELCNIVANYFNSRNSLHGWTPLPDDVTDIWDPERKREEVIVVRLLHNREDDWIGLLGDFLDANEFSEEEQHDIREAMETKGYYHGGGGASPEWTLERVTVGEDGMVSPWRRR